MCLEVPGFNVWPCSIGVGGLDGCTWETDKARIRREVPNGVGSSRKTYLGGGGVFDGYRARNWN